MQAIHLYSFVSKLSEAQHASVQDMHKDLCAALEEHFSVTYSLITESDCDSFDFTHPNGVPVLFVATGGIEGMFVRCVGRFPLIHKTLVMLTDGKQNSLAASIECLAWINANKSNEIAPQLLHGETADVVNALKAYCKIHAIRQHLGQQKIGVFGVPSSWLIASGVDYKAAKEKFGVTFEDIPLSEVYDSFKEVTETDVTERARTFLSSVRGCKGCTEHDVIVAYRLYIALRNVVLRHSLTALTVRCFDIIDALGTTGCLALSLLNDEGIIAGCEGDLQAILTLVLARAVTGKTGFMANPSHISVCSNEVLFAHCTVGTCLTKTENEKRSVLLSPHFESGKGVAIEGQLHEGDACILRANVNKFFLSPARVCENASQCDCCRTQIKVRLEGNQSVKYFLTKTLGNHHIILWNANEEDLKFFFKIFDCEQVIVKSDS